MGKFWKGGAVLVLLLLSTMSTAAATLPPAEPALLAQTTESDSADVRVIPRQGGQGSNHTILVSGLLDGEFVTVRIIEEATGDPVYTTDQTADGNGRVELTVFSTVDDAPGTYIVEVLNRSEDVIGSAELVISEPVGREADVSVTPDTADAGETFTLEISGARPFASLDVVVRDAELRPVFRTTLRADVDGNAIVEFPSERTLSGTHSITVNEGEFTVGQADFVINAVQNVIEVTVQPEEAAPGETVVFSVSGLTPTLRVGVEIRFAGEVVDSSEAEADINGNLVYAYEIPQDAAGGMYSFALVQGGETVLDVAYTVTGDAVEIITADVDAGQSPVVSVTGLQPNEPITLEVLLGGSVISTVSVTSDVNGTVIARISAEDLRSSGTYEVRVVRDGTPLASSDFAVGGILTDPRDVTILTTRDALTIGDSFLVRVTGLAAGETVTFAVRYDDEVVFSTERTADASGAFSIELVTGEGDDPGQYELVVLRDGEELSTALVTIEADDAITDSDVTLTTVPDTIGTGESFTITVEGLPAGEEVVVDVRYEGESVFTTERIAGEEGSFTLRLTSTEDDQPGEYEVFVLLNGEELAAGSFTIIGTTTEQQPDEETAEPGDVTVNIDPETITQGEGFTVTVSGLQAEETVTIDVLYEGESVFMTDRTADADGVIELSLVSSADDEAGSYEVVVLRDGESVAAGDFTVTATEDEGEETAEPGDNVAVVSDPNTVAQGENVTVNISGLEAGETVTLNILYEGEEVFSTEREADQNGRAVVILTTSEDDQPGRYVLVVERDDNQIGAGSFTLTGETTEEPEEVTEAQVSIEPTTGPIGTVHEVTVTGLEAGETVTLEVVFDEAVIFSTDLTADDTGSAVTALVSEEGDEVGDYTLNIVRDDAVVASSILTIEEAVTDAPDEETPEQEQQGDPDSDTEEDTTVGEQPSEIITGRLTADQPDQRISFEGEEGDTVLISVTSPDFDTYLFLLDDQGNQLEFNDDANQSLNSQIGPYTLPYSGEYIVVVSSYPFVSFSEPTAGEFELTIERVGLTEIAYGETVDVTITEDSFTQFFSFEATAGDVISVNVDSGGSIDTVLSLVDPTGFTVFTDDDGGEGFDPELLRFVIPTSGTYTLTLRAFTPGTTGEATLTLNRDDVRTLDDEARVVVLNAKQTRDVLTLTGEAGEAIQLRIVVQDGAVGDFNVNVVQDGQSLMYFQSFGIPSEITLGFVVPQDGEVTIFMDDFTGSASVLEVSIERE